MKSDHFLLNEFLLSKKVWLSAFLLVLSVSIAMGQPVNDNCSNASPVVIGSGGFGVGIFTSTTYDLSTATVQPGETFAPAILVGGQNQKSIWYKFTLPTTRAVRVTLAQPGSAITAGDAGFAVYKTNTCLPSNAEISTKLTPIGIFGNSFHPCVEPGDYLIQVSGKASANGPVYVTVETSMTTAAFDRPAQANNFGTLVRGILPNLNYTVDCQSLEDGAEVCNTLGNYLDYTKSTWHVFNTPAYFDYVAIVLSSGVDAKFGIKVYQGDVRSTPYSTLPIVADCDSLQTIGNNPASKFFGCNALTPNTTYSIQIFYKKDFVSNVALSIAMEGLLPTKAPEPILANVAATTNSLGVLASSPTGVGTAASDMFACNARHSLHPCAPSLPANGVLYNGKRYDLSTFFTFTISGTSNVNISATGGSGSPTGLCGDPYYVRLYKQGLTNSCTGLDTSNIILATITGGLLKCLPAGNYTLQVMGQDSFYYQRAYCQGSNLGSVVDLNISVTTVPTTNRFSLTTPSAYEMINPVAGVMQPMVPGVTYTSQVDTFGCGNTLLPADTYCEPVTAKAIFREFIVPDSGIVSLWSTTPITNGSYKIYKGDASSLSVAQGVSSYPQTITGLTPKTLCLYNTPSQACDGQKVCLTPGTYTSATFGNDGMISITNQMSINFKVVNTVHYNLATAEDLGDILSQVPPAGGTVTSAPDYYSCRDNAIVIDGLAPCKGGYGSPGTKAIYRQFYLSRPASITINSLPFGCDYTPSNLFRGKATDGLAALTAMPAPWRCFTSYGLSECTTLPAGWYTVVSYGWGPSFDAPMRDLNDVYYNYSQYSSMVGYGNKIGITVNVPSCPTPKYNRPYKAAVDSVTHQPFLIQWGPRVGHTSAYPKTDTTYTLYTENFLCDDTPFVSHPIQACDATVTKVAYYVFRTTQESFISVKTGNYWNGDFFAYRGTLYAGDVRTDSASFGTATPIQPCVQMVGEMQICKLLPGTYTLAIFAPPSATCKTITPQIYIDQVGVSRFDHARNAYDFGLVPPDSVYHNGKVGDVNPLDPGRAPSNDFFYCTTGAQPNDPVGGCSDVYIPEIYNPGSNIVMFPVTRFVNTYLTATPKRTLWYTFTVDKGGWVRVKVDPKTIGKGYNYNFAVFKSDVNGTIPFSTLVASGGVDSTLAQGLTMVASSDNGGINCSFGFKNEVVFFRETCSPIQERYYIAIENNNPFTGSDYDPYVMLPNHQLEVSILVDSINAIQPQFDHYYQANSIGTNLGPGSYRGVTDNFSCATRDVTDPIIGVNVPDCGKTLWYKFTTTVSGDIKFRMWNVTANTFEIGLARIQLFRQLIPGDSTANSMQPVFGSPVDLGGNNYYMKDCISPGTYYIVLPNCSLNGGYEYPEIILSENAGDYCSKPVLAPLTGAGSSVSSALINCHTIGTDYGEFNPTLTCPAGAITNNYKSTWFRIDITGADTLDVTTFISNNTTVGSSQIKYRLMNGDCNAMQERSCVQDALTQDTYKCLAPGNYWVQVFSPVNAIGTIDLHLNAVKHVDTCAPINNCLSNANFQKQFDCNVSEAVKFINYSTYGSSISYKWDFGYGGQTSTAVSPSFIYPSLPTAQKYYITLTVKNNVCGGQSAYLDSITIPARPVVNLGADTSLCGGGSVLLNATSFPGSTYAWQNGSTNPTFLAAAPGINNYSVAVSYNGCTSRDTIRVNISTLVATQNTRYTCGTDPVVLNAARNLGEGHHWSTGAITPAINVFTSGYYWDDITLNGCTIRDSFTVSAAVATLGPDRQACFGTTPVVLNATAPGALSYTWQNGSTLPTFTAPAAGTYWVDISFGSCLLRDSITLTNQLPALASANPVICNGLSYTLPSGRIVNTAGIYSDTLRSAGGCDSLVTTVNLTVLTAVSTTSNATICSGSSYTLPWGQTVNTGGVYRDTLRYSVTHCDSAYRIVNLTVTTAATNTTSATICAGTNYTLPWGQVVNATGVYRDTLKFTSSICDSLYRIVNLTVQAPAAVTVSPVVCSGTSYTLPWGQIVNASGIYRDTLRYSTTNCDSVYRIVNLTVQTTATNAISPVVCAGQSYTLPWGQVVNASGIYRDTLRYSVTNCDSVYRIVNLTVTAATINTTNATICAGTNYTLPWGQVVTTSGSYRDTLKFANSVCDSLYRIVNLTVQSPNAVSISPVICAGTNYTLPWGTVVNTSGIYRDTLRYSGTNCDSLYRVVNLTVQTAVTVVTNPSVCAGQSYTLPWGQVVTASGTYRDTLHFNATLCDSVYRIVNLSVGAASLVITHPVICSGSSYTLPWGQIVSAAGTYRDTVKSITLGCDSLYRQVNLSVQSASAVSTTAVICAGVSYTLPWGQVVTAAGTYRDTLRYSVTNCDSLYRTVILTVKAATAINSSPVICAGSSYTLPWGTVVTNAGVYRDTLRYSVTNCDSIYRIVTVTVQAPSSLTTSAKICAGSSYTLPWGTVVTSAGIYRDTVRYSTTNCDSLYRQVTLTVQASTANTVNAVICSGSNYTLPWGQVVNTAGTYRDTLRYSVTNCDSLYRIINLTVQSSTAISTNAVICAGTNYTLPWGAVVTNAGVYRDTLRYSGTHCDSVYRVVTLTVHAATSTTTNATICAGSSYTLPSGRVVSASGTYKDTLHYAITNCDSLYRIVNLTVQSPNSVSSIATICAGSSYVLPNGRVVSAAGIYKDTLHYAQTNCDSLYRSITLIVQTSSVKNSAAVICAGTNYVLPWGKVVTAAGVYRDTLHYAQTNCDSVYRVVTLNVTQPKLSAFSAVICQGETYTLPSGIVTSVAGVYSDTVRTSTGCDSLVRRTNLVVNAKPRISLAKSNDITCTIGISKLTASGGGQYLWSPAASLTGTTISNPVASPQQTTVYHLKVTASNGCTSEDSITVFVNKAGTDGAFDLPNAITPNGDGRNDCFSAKHWGVVSNFEMTIYNRWGTPVFHTNNPGDCWDGTYRGVKLEGNHVYIVKATTICGNILKKGFVIVVR